MILEERIARLEKVVFLLCAVVRRYTLNSGSIDEQDRRFMAAFYDSMRGADFSLPEAWTAAAAPSCAADCSGFDGCTNNPVICRHCGSHLGNHV